MNEVTNAQFSNAIVTSELGCLADNMGNGRQGGEPPVQPPAQHNSNDNDQLQLLAVTYLLEDAWRDESGVLHVNVKCDRLMATRRRRPPAPGADQNSPAPLRALRNALEWYWESLNTLSELAYIPLLIGAALTLAAIALTRPDTPTTARSWCIAALVMLVWVLVGNVAVIFVKKPISKGLHKAADIDSVLSTIGHGSLAASGVWILTQKPADTPLWWEAVIFLDVYFWLAFTMHTLIWLWVAVRLPKIRQPNIATLT